MAKIYYMQIKADKTTIDEVPSRWREQVEGMLNS